jgi:uncharacterized protein (DUF2336 family)
LFDEVMSRLIDEIEEAARATLGHQLAGISNAPPKVIRTLASDESADVAGSVLSRSEQLDEQFLVECAKTKGQDHLLAISRRRSLSEVVTDVLVDRGDSQVAISVSANPGAKFSEFGYSTLVERAGNDSDLAAHVWSRPELSRQHVLKLFAVASDSVRRKLEGMDRRKAALVRDMIAQASDQIQTASRDRSEEFAAARSLVQSLQHSGRLSEAHLIGFARAGKFEETVVAMSLMCDTPIGVVERAIVCDQPDQVIVLAKTIGLSWETTKAVLLVTSGSKNRSKQELERSHAEFVKLRPETARKVLEFYRLRARAAKPSAN